MEIGDYCDSGETTDNPLKQTEKDFMPVLHAIAPLAAPAPSESEVARILRLEVPLIVKLAERKLLLSEVMRLGAGAIIEFFKSSDEPLELLVNNKVIGVGEAVKVGENFGLRIRQVGDIRQIVQALGNG
jgi:flagellar motor switch protein FliN/FliY